MERDRRIAETIAKIWQTNGCSSLGEQKGCYALEMHFIAGDNCWPYLTHLSSRFALLFLSSAERLFSCFESRIFVRRSPQSRQQIQLKQQQ